MELVLDVLDELLAQITPVGDPKEDSTLLNKDISR
jgi:hypothetical protein